MNKTPMRLMPALLLLAFSGAASAAAFQLWEQNASGISTAYAGSAAVGDNAGTIFFNPAAMTLLPGTQVSLGVAAVRPSFEFHNDGSSGTGLMTGLSGSGGGDAGSWAAVPNAYFSYQLSPQWAVGLGISSPFGLNTQYSNDWVGRFQSLKSEIRTVNFNPALAYRLNDKVSLGFGLDYQHLDAEMTSMLPGGATYRVKGDANSWGWNAGALFTLSPAMRVGVSYRSAIKHELEGDRSLGAVTSSAKADLKLPGTFILSVWQQVSDRWEAMGDLSYTNWNTLDVLKIYYSASSTPDVENFGYRNSWRFAWGAAYKVNDAWKAKFGIAYDRTPTVDENRSARVPDNDRIWLSFGGQWKPARSTTLDFGYSYLYVRNPAIEQTRNFGLAGQATLRGHYDDSAHILGVQYSQGF